MQLHILVATMSGTAESVAQTLQLVCSDSFNPIHIHRMETVDSSIFDEDALFLICSSTYGSGDVPDNGQTLYAQLDAEPRYLGHVRYGLVALGDSSYGDTYGMGGMKLDARLQDLCALCIGEIGRLDASSGDEPEDEATTWCETWLTQALATP